MSQMFIRPEDILQQSVACMRDDWTGFSINGSDITLNAGKCILFNATLGAWQTYDVPAKTLSITSGSNRFYVYLNGGIPAFQSDQVVFFVPNFITNALVATTITTVTGTSVKSYANVFDNIISGMAVKVTVGPFASFFTNDPEKVLSENGVNNVAIASLSAFRGTELITSTDIPSFDSGTAGNNLYIYTYDGAAWVKEPATTAYEKTRYQTPTGTAAVSPNRWTVNYVFRSTMKASEGNAKEAYILLGSGNYVDSDAAKNDVINLNRFKIPNEIGFSSCPIGRIIAHNDGDASIINGWLFNKPNFTA